jgi:GNAT superfamily N-acetyltransferase
MISDAGTEAGCCASALLKGEACWIAASVDGGIAGIAGIVTVVDSAAIGALFVVEPRRRHGIGSKLLDAARKAAHTRGANRLYAPVCKGASFLAGFGFEATEAAEMIENFAGTGLGDYLHSQRDKWTALRLDISRDGIIER